MFESELIVEPVPGFNAITMTWPSNPTVEAVRKAFVTINDYLEEADSELHVIVDLLNDPNIPVTMTFHYVIQGPFSHPNMGKWLVVGKNQRAQTVSELMNVIQRNENIVWFESTADALGYMKPQSAGVR